MAAIEEKVEESLGGMPKGVSSIISGYAWGRHPICALVENAFEQHVWCEYCRQYVHIDSSVVLEMNIEGNGPEDCDLCCSCADYFDDDW
jgi:hypothetical protein